MSPVWEQQLNDSKQVPALTVGPLLEQPKSEVHAQNGVQPRQYLTLALNVLLGKITERNRALWDRNYELKENYLTKRRMQFNLKAFV